MLALFLSFQFDRELRGEGLTMLRLSDSWVWDFWTADDGDQYHLFFLHAPRHLINPDARHYKASIGHAVSANLRDWQRLDDALARSTPTAFDDLATWTGSVVQHPDGTWFLFYTGTTLVDGTNVQTIGYATSDDLTTWTKAPGPVLEADPRWYEKLADGQWHDEAFRDPWVLADPDGRGWHLLATGRSNHGPADDRGVVAHAWSPDLRNWQVRPPLSDPGSGFGQLEVVQPVQVDGLWFLIFNCLASDLSAARLATGTTGGVWAARADGPLGPYQVADAQQLTDSRLYVGKVVTDRETRTPWFLAFRNDSPEGFVGEITDPMSLAVRDGRLVADSQPLEGWL